MSASNMLQVLYPGVFQALQDAVAPLAWDYVILPLLTLPGWILAGVPGGVLVWHYRPRPEPGEEEDGEVPGTTYEDIIASAREAEEQDIGLPSKYRDLDEYDPTNPPVDAGDEPAIEPYELERADIVPPARYIAPRSGGGEGKG